MFRFEHPQFLYLLGLIPVLVVFFMGMWYARKRALARFAETGTLSRMLPKLSRFKHPLKFGLSLLGLALLIIGLANPQWGTKRRMVERQAVDVFVALDLSQSMMAEDIPPNRLEKAKRFGEELINELKGNRVGLLVFAANAYLQMPLTTDYAAATLFLKSANPDQLPYQGTAIGEAIELAEKHFPEDNQNHKALIIITDGETHDEATMELAKTAARNGLLIYTVGVGTEKGTFVPVWYNGNKTFKKDRSGEPIQSQLNPEMLSNLADAGNGAYFHINQSQEVATELKAQIDRIEKRKLEARIFDEYESYFQYFLAAGLLILLIEFMLSYRKEKWAEGKDLFANK